jgi:hypothetical protein
MALPVMPAQWNTQFERHFRMNSRAQDKYDTAGVCRIEFAAEELGAFAIQCESEFVPLRWAVRRRGGSPVVRLIDDSGEAKLPEVSRFTFEMPAVSERLCPGQEFAVAAPGGLYVAQQQGSTAGVVALPPIRSLAGLGCTPHIDTCERSLEAVIRDVELARLWGTANSSGDPVSLRNQRVVLRAIAQHVLGLIGGEAWANAEQELAAGRDPDMTKLKQAVVKVHANGRIADVLAAETVDLAVAARDARISRLTELATRQGLLPPGPPGKAEPGDSRWLVELALRLASSPKDVASWAGLQLRPGAVSLLAMPALARAARFIVLATTSSLRVPEAPGELYASWGWT